MFKTFEKKNLQNLWWLKNNVDIRGVVRELLMVYSINIEYHRLDCLLILSKGNKLYWLEIANDFLLPQIDRMS